MTALGDGFYSVWMTVFANEPQILLALIDGFVGTNKNCYDEEGNVKRIFQFRKFSRQSVKVYNHVEREKKI